MGKMKGNSPQEEGQAVPQPCRAKKRWGAMKAGDSEKTLSSDEIHLRAISAIHGGRLGKFKAAAPMAQEKERIQEYLRIKNRGGPQ